ncbi:hypothetical protein ABZT00_38700, partial [Streptomyces sp. NPDC005486]
LRRWIGGFVARHKKVLGLVDRGSILLVVNTGRASSPAANRPPPLRPVGHSWRRGPAPGPRKCGEHPPVVQ